MWHSKITSVNITTPTSKILHKYYKITSKQNNLKWELDYQTHKETSNLKLANKFHGILNWQKKKERTRGKAVWFSVVKRERELKLGTVLVSFCACKGRERARKGELSVPYCFFSFWLYSILEIKVGNRLNFDPFLTKEWCSWILYLPIPINETHSYFGDVPEGLLACKVIAIFFSFVSLKCHEICLLVEGWMSLYVFGSLALTLNYFALM